MSKHFLLTSKSVAIPFIIVYFLTRELYLLVPITTSYLIHCVETNDYHHFILTAIFFHLTYHRGTDYIKSKKSINQKVEDNQMKIITDSLKNIVFVQSASSIIHKDHILITNMDVIK